MIRKIRARNFLSLRDVDLELANRNLLVGPNMSGKSNLIDLLRFLTTIATARPGLHTATLQRGGFNEILWKGGDERQISLALAVELPSAVGQAQPQVFEYTLSLLGGGPGGTSSVASEKLTVSVDNGVPRSIYEIGPGGQGVVEEQGKSRAINLPSWSTALESVGLPNVEADRFRSFVASWRFYFLIPALMRQENAPSPELFLKEHGENLSSWITTLQTSEEFGQIRQVVRDAFPDLAEIIIQPTQASRIVLSTRERHLKGTTSIFRMSEGELAFLALVSLIFAPTDLSAPLYCVEEPENYWQCPLRCWN